MKKNVLKLIFASICLFLGWVLGYIRFPYLEENHSFWLGVAASVAFVLLFVSLYNEFRNRKDNRLLSKKMTGYFLFGSALCFAVISIVLFGLIMNKEKDLKNQENFIKNQANQIVVLEQQKLSPLFASLMSDIRLELAASPRRELSKEIIDNLIDLSKMFKPYRVLDSMVLSPERGQMLVFLAKMGIGESSFQKIKEKVDFSYSDLRREDLSGLDLSQINLRHSNLSQANLFKTRFRYALLSNATFVNSALIEGDFYGSHLERANFNWSNMTRCNLDSTNLNDSQFESANLNEASFDNSRMMHTQFQGATLSNTKFNYAYLYHVNFTRTNLTNADLTTTKLEWSIFDSTLLDNAKVTPDWLKSLDSLHNFGLHKVGLAFKEVVDTSSVGKKFRILIPY